MAVTDATTANTPSSVARILVVDDDALVAMSTVDMLADLGHQVYEANSGADALAILRSDSAIDLMVTDFSMPQMNGAQLAAAALELHPDLPILLATGYIDPQEKAGVKLPFILKPFDQAHLADKIAKLLT